MEELFLPVLSHFQNGNFWSASAGRMSYRVVPDGEKLAAEVWEGPWCYQLSRVEERREFPMDESGLADLAAWAGRSMPARPGRWPTPWPPGMRCARNRPSVRMATRQTQRPLFGGTEYDLGYLFYVL